MDIDELARRIATAKPITSLNVRDDHWPEVDCDGAVFTDCVFEAVQFSYPSFVDARFSNCRFVSCRVSHAALKGAVFETCQFTGDGGKGCTFVFSDLPFDFDVLSRHPAAVQWIRREASPQHDAIGKGIAGGYAERERVGGR